MKKMVIILIAGIALRLLLAVSTFHPDSLAFKLGGELVASGNILNLYNYSDPNVAVLNYPPAIYWFHGFFKFLLGSFLHGVLLIKLPYLIFDIWTAFLLSKLFTGEKQTSLAFAFWLFNPINLYATYMMGQFDIIPTFFTVLSVYLISKNRLSWAALSLGGGIAFKIYPLFLLIPLALLGKSYFDKLKFFILGLLPYSVSILPYLPSHSFRSTALFAAQSSKSLYAAIAVSGGESILLFPMFLGVFYLILLRRKISNLSFWKMYLILLLTFFIFTHYHPQWLIWVTPFLILDLIIERFKNLTAQVLIFISWFGSLFFFDPSLTLGIFSPIWPSLKDLSLWGLVGLHPDYNLSRSLLQTVFSASSFYLIYVHFFNRENV